MSVVTTVPRSCIAFNKKARIELKVSHQVNHVDLNLVSLCISILASGIARYSYNKVNIKI